MNPCGCRGFSVIFPMSNRNTAEQLGDPAAAATSLANNNATSFHSRSRDSKMQYAERTAPRRGSTKDEKQAESAEQEVCV